MSSTINEPVGRLESALRRGEFVVTCELGPPRGADPEAVRRDARRVKGWVHAANMTDGQGAVVRMTPLAASFFCLEEGLETVMQLSCRDRNRIALQSEVMGAAALGITNLLCLTGDDPRAGDQPDAKPVFDLDSLGLLDAVAKLKAGTLLNGKRLSVAPKLFVGCAENPFAPPVETRAARLAEKATLGAQFCQTQIVYDLPAFARFMDDARRLGLLDHFFVLAGVSPIRSARAVTFMREHVAGVVIPDEIANRIERTPAERQEEEGLRLCVELVDQLRAIPGVAGVHLMAPGWEDRAVPEIVTRAGLRPELRPAQP